MKISQTKIIYDLLLDGEPHSTYDMVNLIRPDGGLVRISERIREIQKQHGIVIDSWPDSKNRSMWWYLIKPVEIPLEEMPEYSLYNPQSKL
jgi:hypothetical protein